MMEKPLFGTTASRCFLYEGTNPSQWGGRIFGRLSLNVKNLSWGSPWTSVLSTEVLFGLSLMIDNFLPTFFLLNVLHYCPAGRSFHVSSARQQIHLKYNPVPGYSHLPFRFICRAVSPWNIACVFMAIHGSLRQITWIYLSLPFICFALATH